jgi:hypothetical protein
MVRAEGPTKIDNADKVLKGPAPSIHSHITLSTGTAAAPTCQPHIEHDSSIDKSKNIYMCLAATNMFKDFSPEEMRLGDIVSGRRGKC